MFYENQGFLFEYFSQGEYLPDSDNCNYNNLNDCDKYHSAGICKIDFREIIFSLHLKILHF